MSISVKDNHLSIVPTEPKAALYSKDRQYLTLLDNAEEYKILKISAGPANCETPRSIFCRGKNWQKAETFLWKGCTALLINALIDPWLCNGRRTQEVEMNNYWRS